MQEEATGHDALLDAAAKAGPSVGVVSGVVLGTAVSHEKVKEVVLSTELSGGGRQERGGGDRGQELQHFLRIGATMEEGLSLLAEEQSTEERKIVRTRFSSASSENIHLLCIWHLCLPLIALITL